jgi:hypothetical protein
MTNERKEVCEHVEGQLSNYFDIRLKGLEKYIDARLKALEEATKLARENMERRLENLNELRQQVVTDRSQFVSRELHDRLQDEVSDIRSAVGKGAIIIGIIVTVLQIAEPVALYFAFHH